MTQQKVFRVVYDGDCPFCKSYVAYARLKEQFDEVELVDARSRPDLVKKYNREGYDLNQGMIVEADGQTYFGGEALWAINTLISSSLVLKLVGNRTFLKCIYPSLRACRNLSLRIMGRDPIAIEENSSNSER